MVGSRVPSPFLPTLDRRTFFEGFAYSAGGLIGKGGWFDFAVNDPVVASAGNVTGVASAVARAYSNSLVPGIDWTRPWSFSIVFSGVAGPPIGERVTLLGGAVDTGVTWSAKLDIVGGHFIWLGSDGTTSTTAVGSFPAGNQTMTISYDGAGNLAFSYATTHFTVPSGSFASATDPVLGFQIDANSNVADPTVHSISGTYRT